MRNSATGHKEEYLLRKFAIRCALICAVGAELERVRRPGRIGEEARGTIAAPVGLATIGPRVALQTISSLSPGTENSAWDYVLSLLVHTHKYKI